ncbi:ABC transporter ATP-binding protein [Polycladidibacter stylochi]|uniref:ABC transporter ATP-binding protein n=1 Tax=Polycladidibacter stylochi TaxID=1807766 RepID=UPI00082FECE0|nr:ABC transporter ATP-binding protein [Pseudovibrio stylochi]
MSSVRINGISKSFGSYQALKALDLAIQEGEFLCVLGPSGCGKTTLLRLIAGLEMLDAGEIWLGNTLVSSASHHSAPEERQVGMVFQSYALWPHMSVAENAAFPLKTQKITGTERELRIDNALEATRLGAFKSRRPAELSGGQQQRVALARCLTQAPKLVLMDEPLANLDMHLREDMLAEFKTFHRKSGATILYITHDQSEAMSVADRIAVMLEGRLQQLARPEELYSRPVNGDVARFIGSGAVIKSEVSSKGRAKLGLGSVAYNSENQFELGASLSLVVRPEDVKFGSCPDGAQGIICRVKQRRYLGGKYRMLLELEHNQGVVELVSESVKRVEVGEILPAFIEQVWACT